MPRVSPSMAVALLALFVALGGTGYAATKLNGRDIVNGSIAGAKLKRNTLGARQVKESSLGKVPSASDADFLDGRPSSAYLLTGASAANAFRLDGLDSSAFLPAGGTAANSQMLQGNPAAAFQRVGATAADSARLGGRPASDFLPASRVLSAGPVAQHAGDTATLFAAGPLTVLARCTSSGGRPQAQVVLRHTVALLDPVATGDVSSVAAGDTVLAGATYAAGAANVARQAFTAVAQGATALQGTATAVATPTGCSAAAFAVTSP